MTDRRPHWDDDLIEAAFKACPQLAFEREVYPVIAAVEDWFEDTFIAITSAQSERIEKAETAIQRVIANADNAPTNWRINGTTDHLTPLGREWVEAAERWRDKWHDTLVVKGMDHEIVVTLSERYGLAVQFRCNMDVDAPCRARCPQHCESDCEHDKEPGHPCAYLPWMDGDMYGDYYVGPDVPAFASGPVEFIWNGDGYDWKYQDGWFEQ